MKFFNICIGFLLSVLLFSCAKKEKEESKTETPFFELLSAEASGIHFKNQLTPTYDTNIIEFDYFYNGGGVALGDVNNDGLTDVFFSGNMVSSALYINKGALKFEEVTKKSGLETNRWATGVTMVDINEDGLLDIYVCFSGLGEAKDRKNSFFIHQGILEDGTPQYKEMATEIGLSDDGFTTQAAFFDYDKDGDLDVYVLTALHDKLNPNYPKKKENNSESKSTDRLYRNDGLTETGLPKFTNISKEAGITYEGYGLGIAINDINGDGWEDIYVANDFIFDDLIYVNQGDGSFKEKSKSYIKHSSRFSMGCDMADVNNDNLVDLLVLDMLPEDNHRQKMMSTATSYQKYKLELEQGYTPQYSRNTFQLNRGKDKNGQPIFSEIGYMSDIYKTDWSWSPLLVDFDNDGYRDLFITNGIPKDITNNDYISYREHNINVNADYDALKKDFLGYIEKLPDTYFSNYMFKNLGKDSVNAGYSFKNVSKQWGLDALTCSNGAAFGDLDNDGDLDLVVNNVNDRAFIYKSNASDKEGHWLRVKLHGEASNAQGLGAKVTIKTNNKEQFHHQSLVRGFQSSQEVTIHFGLGKDTIIETLTVVWADGKSQKMYNLPVDKVISVYQEKAGNKIVETSKFKTHSYFTDVTKGKGINYRQTENDFDDFNGEFLLPHQYSKMGPSIAVGDVNGDGLEDFIVGGAVKSATQLFIQKANGKFTSTSLDTNQNLEDMGLLLFDCDNDSDLDLYIVRGGSEYVANTPPYQDRLYVNDGQGNFKLKPDALPKMYASGSCVTAADYDNDGDLDLFVGGRIEAGKYPLPTRSYLLRNDNGKFIDVTLQSCENLFKPGLVTSAIWTDFDNDKDKDLIVVGEWMPISFYRNNGGKFTNITKTTGIQNHTGWWNSISSGDFDNDGDIDYIAGNLGLNSNFKASSTEPVSIVANDFDRNGSIDPILSSYTQGKSYPKAGRDLLAQQMTIFTKKKFRDYNSYADATVADLFTAEELASSYHANATYFKSSYIENLGNGQFKMHALPLEAQFAPVFGMLVKDFNTDGNLDVLLSGNSHASNYMTGQYDAMQGLLLTGDGKGSFKSIPFQESGFYVAGDQKALAVLQTATNEPMVIALANSGDAKVFYFEDDNKTIIPLKLDDSYAEIELFDGTKQIKEFYYGSGYLSQSSRSLVVSENMLTIKMYNTKGEARIVFSKKIK